MFLVKYEDIDLMDGVSYFIKDHSVGSAIVTVGYGVISSSFALPIIHKISGTVLSQTLSIFQIFDVRYSIIDFNVVNINWRVSKLNGTHQDLEPKWVLQLLSPVDMEIHLASEMISSYAYQATIGKGILRRCTDYKAIIKLDSGIIQSYPWNFSTETPTFFIKSLHVDLKDVEVNLTWSILDDCIYSDAYYMLYVNDQLIEKHINRNCRSYLLMGLSRNTLYNITLSACHQGICNDIVRQAKTTITNLDKLSIAYVKANGTNSIFCSILEHDRVDFFVFIVVDDNAMVSKRVQETCHFIIDCAYLPKSVKIYLQMGVRLNNGSSILSKPTHIFVGQVPICWTAISIVLFLLIGCGIVVITIQLLRPRNFWGGLCIFGGKYAGSVILPDAIGDILENSSQSQRSLTH